MIKSKLTQFCHNICPSPSFQKCAWAQTIGHQNVPGIRSEETIFVLLSSGRDLLQVTFVGWSVRWMVCAKSVEHFYRNLLSTRLYPFNITIIWSVSEVGETSGFETETETWLVSISVSRHETSQLKMESQSQCLRPQIKSLSISITV